MNSLAGGLLVAALISILACASLWAQATAQISGTVKDQSGAVLPGVEITATQTETGISRNTITNETGSYVLPKLATGPYRLEAALPGFRTFVQSGVVLQVNSNPVINPVLEVGQITEQVEVEANAVQVETRNVGIGQIMENERILELPLNGRQVTDLITLSGAAVQTASTAQYLFGGQPYISVGGGSGFGVAYNLDGAQHINFLTGVGMPLPFPDALQEFKVETSGLSAQTGRDASIGGVTKSGTNDFHGDLFEYVRNDLFNARQYFAPTGSSLKRNQFGGTIGGPILRNKLFFFAAYQGTTIRQDPANLEAFIPTAAMMAGDWTAFASPACNGGRQITLRAPFVGTRIDPALYSRAAVNIAGRLPQTSDPCGRFTYGRRNIEDDGQYVGKIDYQLSDKQSLFGRYVASRVEIPQAFRFTPDNLLNSGTNGFDNLAQSFGFGDTYLVGPNMVNSFRIAVNRVASLRLGNEFFSYCDMGINMYCGYAQKRTGAMTVNGGFGIGISIDPRSDTYRPTSYQLNDDVSLVRTTHQMSFGVSLMHGRHKSVSNFVSGGTMNFDGSVTGLGMGDFFVGRLTSLLQGAQNTHEPRQSFFALYGADTWKATPRLTLNYGLRWEPYFPQTMINGASYNFSYERFRQGVKSSVFRNAPAGFYYPGDPGFPDNTVSETQWAHFAPRVGLAWDLRGDGRTSVRASYAFSYAFVSGLWREDTSGSPPWGNRTTILSPVGGLDNPWQGVPGGNPFPYQVDQNAPFARSGLYLTSPYDIKTPSSSSWNLSIQRQVAASWMFSTSYLGTLTSHIWTLNPINPATYFPGGPCTLNGVTYNPCSSPGNTDARRRFSLERPQDGQLMGSVAEFDAGGTQNYHAMLLSVQRRAVRGIIVNGNYTWSHCLGPNADIDSAGPPATQTYLQSYNRNFDRGNCDSDRRHSLNLTGVAETPQFGGRALRLLTGGWKLSGIYRVSSGSPLTILAGSDRSLTGVSAQRANQILASPYGDTSGRPFTSYLNRSAVDVPALGTFGNMGRASVRGPKTWSFDLALSRVFIFREDQRLEFRAEAYNVTNSFRPGNPNTTTTNNTFGQLRTSGDPRIFQFALKYVF